MKKYLIVMIAVLAMICISLVGCNTVNGGKTEETSSAAESSSESSKETGSAGEDGSVADTETGTDNNETESQETDVKIVTENMELKVGEKPDWNGHVKVTVNGVAVEDPTIEWTLKGGDETVVGRCTYEITFVYEGVTYSRNGFVNFIADGETDTEEETTSSGQGGSSLSVEELSALNAMLSKGYDSYTFEYKYFEVGKEDYFEHEIDKVNGTNVYIVYHNVDVDVDSEFDYYISEGSEQVYYYYPAEDGSDAWYYEIYTPEDYYNYGYNIWPFAFTLDVCELDGSYFVKAGENKYAVEGQTAIYLVADAVFGLGDEQTYTSIVITVDGENIVGIKGEYTDVAEDGTEYSAVIEYKWSDFDATEVKLPENATEYVEEREEMPEHISPEDAEKLSAEDKTKLENALGATYTEISFSYVNDKGDGNMYVSGNGSIKGEWYRDLYHEAAIYDGEEFFVTDYECIFRDLGENSIDYYEYLNEYGDFIHVTLEGKAEDYTSYIAVDSLGLTADLFGKCDGAYVVLADKLSDMTEKLDAAFSISDNFTSFTLITFVVELDADGNVKEFYLLADCEDEYGVFYWQLNYSYNYGDVEITLPTENNLKDLTAEQTSEITGVLSGDYSNVTVFETYGDSYIYYVGNSVMHKGEDYYGEYADLFLKDGDKYYRVLGDKNEEIPATGVEGFENEVPVFHFECIDVSKMKYDEIHGVYYIDADSVDLSKFAFYFADIFEVYGEIFEENYGVTFDSFDCYTFTVKDGKLVQIKAISDVFSVSAVFSDHSETVIPEE